MVAPGINSQFVRQRRDGQTALSESILQVSHSLHVPANSSLRIILPKYHFIQKSISVPPVDEGELPEIIQLQAATLFSNFLPQDVVDFVPIPPDADIQKDNDTHPILIAKLPEATLTEIKTAAESLKLSLDAAVPRPVATAQKLTEDGFFTNQGAIVIVAEFSDGTDAAIFKDGKLTAYSTIEHAENEERHVFHKRAGSELKRFLLAETGQTSQSRLDCVIVLRQSIESQAAELVESIVTCPIQIHSISEDEILQAAAIDQEKIDSVDFANPKKSMQPTADRRSWYAAAVTVLLLIGAIILWKNLRAAALDRQIESVRLEIDKITEELDSDQSTIPLVDAVTRWKSERIVWLDQLEELTEMMPDREQLYFDSWHVELSSGVKPPNMRAVGNARTRENAEDFISRLATKPDIEVLPSAIVQTDSSTYPYQFELNILLRPELDEDRNSKRAQRKGRLSVSSLR